HGRARALAAARQGRGEERRPQEGVDPGGRVRGRPGRGVRRRRGRGRTVRRRTGPRPRPGERAHRPAARPQDTTPRADAASLPGDAGLRAGGGERPRPRQALRVGAERGRAVLRARRRAQQEDRRAGGGDDGARRAGASRLGPPGMRVAVALLALALDVIVARVLAATPSVPPAVAAMVPRGRAAGTLPLPHIVVFLRIPDRPGLDDRTAAERDPGSPGFRRWLDPTEIADRFGARREHYERVRRWFVDRGFGVVADSPYRIALALEGTAQLAADALGAPIGVFRYRGQLYHAPLAAPAPPADLRVPGRLGPGA